MLGKRKKTGQGVRSFHRIGHPIKHKKSSNHVDKTLLLESLESVEDSLELIQQRVMVNEPPDGWYMNYVADKELQYFQVVRQQLNTPMVVLRLFLINRDLRYQMYVAGHLVSPQSSILSKLPSIVTVDAVIHMINAFHDANICLGNFDDSFINLAHKKKGKFLSCNGQLTAYLDE